MNLKFKIIFWVIALLGILGNRLRFLFSELPLFPDRVILVTAHPDDEVLFFLPSLRRFQESYVLCLSTGNADGLGQVRVKEFYESLKILGLRGRLIDDALLQDSWSLWPADRIQYHVNQTLHAFPGYALLTFDNKGVSGHPNHISIAKAVETLPIPTYSLVSHWPYFGILRLWSTATPLTLRSTWKDYKIGIQAMRSHASQFVWFRKLNVLCSSYLWQNQLEYRH